MTRDNQMRAATSSHRSSPFIGGVLVVCALMSGCASTYMETRRENAPGGVLDQKKAAAQQDLTTARQQNVDLTDATVQRRREMERMDARLKAVNNDLRQSDVDLNEALRAKRVSQERYNQLKRQLDAVKNESQSLELDNKAALVGKPDPAAEAAKRARLAELEKKKADLENAFKQMNVKK